MSYATPTDYDAILAREAPRRSGELSSFSSSSF